MRRKIDVHYWMPGCVDVVTHLAHARRCAELGRVVLVHHHAFGTSCRRADHTPLARQLVAS